MELNPYSFISLAAFLAVAALALYLLVGKSRSAPRKLFAISLAIVSVACLADFMARNSVDACQVAPLYRFVFTALVLASFVTLESLLGFLDRKLPAPAYLVPAAFAIGASLTDWFIADAFSATAFGQQWAFGRFAFLLFLYFVATAAYSLALLASVYRRLQRQATRRKFLWLMAGLTVLFVPPILGSFAPLFGIEALPLFPPSSAIGGAMITYSFLLGGKHGG